MSLAENDWLWTAWTQAWQVTVLIVAVAILTRLAAARRPQLAFALWLVVFVKCVTPPLWSSPTGAFCWLQPPQTTLAENSQGTLAVVVLPVDTASPVVDSHLPRPDTDGQTLRAGPDMWCPGAWLAAIWIAGSVAMFGAIAVRWRRIGQLVRGAGCGPYPHWEALLESLVRRLRLRRGVRLVVTERPVGPAVLGLFRPTVLLPRAVIEGKSSDEIELILAHELMHVRRGDPCFALLRSLVLSIWWFHPLVWWAGRRASREAERCCDEAVLAELRCNPARYARCLLDILEIKHQLSPVPAFPGVRAIEVTQGRLERIMKIGQGGYRRTPWWCWAVVVLAAVVALPGAAIHIAAGEKPNEQPAEMPLWAYAIPSEVDPGSAPQPIQTPIGTGTAALTVGDKTPVVHVIYEAGDVLAKIREKRGLSESEAREFLNERVKCSVPVPTPVCGQHQVPTSITWSDSHMIIEATRMGHKQVVEMLDAFRKFGTAEIEVRVLFVALSAKELQQALPDWTMSPLDVPELPWPPRAVQPAAFDRPLGSHVGTRVARAHLLVEKDSPVRYRIVDEEQGTKLLDRFQADARTNILQAPKATLFNGQTAFVSDTSQSPFVVGVKEIEGEIRSARQPQIRVVSEGTTVQFRPVVDPSGAVHLDYAVTCSKIRDVDTVSFASTAAGGPTIQVPEVATARMEGGATLKQGQWLLLGGLDCKDQAAKPEATTSSWKSWLFGGSPRENQQAEPQAMIVMLRAQKKPLPAVAATRSTR